MHGPITASIIITSYNYGRFLSTAIDSALHQTHPGTEVIVVDDGSQDSSREVIAGYGNRIISHLKENGGQASAFNVGFKLSSGGMVIFLDSDDMLLPETVEKAAALFRADGLSKVHWNLAVADDQGKTSGDTVRKKLAEGDLRASALEAGADGYVWPPTSGNAWSREFLEGVLPIPEREFVTCPDLYLASLAPLYGRIGRIDTVQGFWRFHPVNASFSTAFAANLAGGLCRADRCVQAIADHAARMGLPCNSDTLRKNSRWHQMDAAVHQIEQIVPNGESFILVDQDDWATGGNISGRRCLPFFKRGGQFWGCPGDDAEAIAELEKLRAEGAKYIVFVWPYLWWLDYYRGFEQYLKANYTLVSATDRLVSFALNQASGSNGEGSQPSE